MLTPQEIQETKFEKAVFGGYDMAQIDKFLDELLVDYTMLYKENAALKGKMRVLVDKIDEYRAVDEEMRKALYTAQVTAKDIKEKAEAEAKKTIEDAEAEAKRRGENVEAEIYANALRLKEIREKSSQFAADVKSVFEKAMGEISAVENKEIDAYLKQAFSDINKNKAHDEFEIVLPDEVKNDDKAVASAQEEPTREIEIKLDDQPASDEDVLKLDFKKIEQEPAEEPQAPKVRFNFTDLKFGKDYKNQD